MANPILMASMESRPQGDINDELMIEELIGGEEDWLVDPAELERARLRWVHNTKRQNQYRDYLETAVCDVEVELWDKDPKVSREPHRMLDDLLTYTAYGIVFGLDDDLIRDSAESWRRAQFQMALYMHGIGTREHDSTSGYMKLVIPAIGKWKGIMEEQGMPNQDWAQFEREVHEQWDHRLEMKLNSIQENIEHTLVKKLRDADLKAQAKERDAARKAEEQRKAQEAAGRASLGWGEF